MERAPPVKTPKTRYMVSTPRNHLWRSRPWNTIEENSGQPSTSAFHRDSFRAIKRAKAEVSGCISYSRLHLAFLSLLTFHLLPGLVLSGKEIILDVNLPRFRNYYIFNIFSLLLKLNLFGDGFLQFNLLIKIKRGNWLVIFYQAKMNCLQHFAL